MADDPVAAASDEMMQCARFGTQSSLDVTVKRQTLERGV